jgi:hypothetical protein
MAIGAEHFSTNMYVLSLDSFGHCPGWLGTLGPIMWDFGAPMMSF